jgi:hypothetical protein
LIHFELDEDESIVGLFGKSSEKSRTIVKLGFIIGRTGKSTSNEMDKKDRILNRASVRIKERRPISNASTLHSTMGTVPDQDELIRCKICYELKPDFSIPCGCFYHVECLEEHFSD